MSGASVPKEGTDFGPSGEAGDFTSIEIALNVDEAVKVRRTQRATCREHARVDAADLHALTR